jgi:hypothetical protein
MKYLSQRLSAIKTINELSYCSREILDKRFLEEIRDFSCGGQNPSWENQLSCKEAREQLKQLDKKRIIDIVSERKLIR